MSDTKRVTCQNSMQDKRKRGNETRFTECRGCPLVYAHKADSWLDDVVRCNSPLPIKYGDTIEIVSETARLVP